MNKPMIFSSFLPTSQKKPDKIRVSTIVSSLDIYGSYSNNFRHVSNGASMEVIDNICRTNPICIPDAALMKGNGELMEKLFSDIHLFNTAL